MSGEPTIAYLAEGKLYLKSAGASPRLIESTFAQNAIDRAIRTQQRSGWKSGGFGPEMNPAAMLMGGRSALEPNVRKIRMESLARGPAGELLYAMDMGTVGGIFSFELGESYEKRLFHRAEFRPRDLSRHPAHDSIVLSMRAVDGSANIAVLDVNGRGLREITEGDSVDESPTWVPGNGKQIVYQSAGIGRNAAGVRTALGPYSLHRLDLENDQFETLLEDSGHDFLLPRMDNEGSLYFIQRPYRPGHSEISILRVGLDILLFPFRLAQAFVHFFNFFSQMFSGKPLMTAGGPRREGADPKTLMLWGKMIDADKALKAAKGADLPALVPESWQLIRRDKAGDEIILAKSVLAYDLAPDGGVIHTNGSSVFHRDASGHHTKLCSGNMIEHVIHVPPQPAPQP